MTGASERVRALAFHARPAEIKPLLAAESRFDWRFVSTPADVGLALRGHRPEVVFSLKTSLFPGAAHAMAMDDRGVRWFHVAGAGTDHIDRLRREGLHVTDSRGVLAPFLAEREMAGLLHLTTGMAGTLAAQGAGRWEPTRFRALAGREVLVVGAGHTGAAFARRVGSFGCVVRGVRASGEPRPEFHTMHRPGELDELLPRADVLALHVRLDERTRGMFGARRLGLLPPGALLLNASRGPVVVERDLPAALEGNLAGAWLDVFEEEPLPPESPLWRHPRVLVSPHHADQVDDFPAHFARHFLELSAAWLADPGARSSTDPA